MPTSYCSSPAWGGPKLDILYVVTAGASANILRGTGESNVNVPYPGGQLLQVTNWCARGTIPPPKPYVASDPAGAPSKPSGGSAHSSGGAAYSNPSGGEGSAKSYHKSN